METWASLYDWKTKAYADSLTPTPPGVRGRIEMSTVAGKPASTTWRGIFDPKDKKNNHTWIPPMIQLNKDQQNAFNNFLVWVLQRRTESASTSIKPESLIFRNKCKYLLPRKITNIIPKIKAIPK